MQFPVLSFQQISSFSLVFLRITALIVMIPVFGDRTVPARVKAGLGLILAVIIYPFLKTDALPPVSSNYISMIIGMAGEVLIGIIIGFVARCIFAGVQSAGELIGFQMGFSMASVLDPLSNTQISALAEFQYLIAMIVFLFVDGHHIFLNAIVESYRSIPPLGFSFSGPLMEMLFNNTKEVFVIAVKISAPIMAVMIFVNVGLGVIARTVPQINVFIVGFPLQIAVGFFFLGLSIPLLVNWLGSVFHQLPAEIRQLMLLM
ncbi:MAG: flagellar biosynthetic protein FliR [Syntrophales bacterium]